MFRRVETRFFSVLQLFKYVKSFGRILQSIRANWFVSTHIYRRFSTHLNLIFTKKPASTLPNTPAARIFVRVSGNRRLTLENAAWVFPDNSQKCAGPISLPCEHPNNNYCCNPLKSRSRPPIDAGMPLCHYDDTGVYKWSFYLNSQDFCVSLANRCHENAEPVYIL